MTPNPQSTPFDKFLCETEYLDYSHLAIQNLAYELMLKSGGNKLLFAENAYKYVRDEIPHSFDIESDIVTVKASDVLLERTGICHAKANLLAAILRARGIPAGFCFEYITLAHDDKLGYCIHGFSAVYLEEKWIKLDARGNKAGINAEFSLEKFHPAFPPRAEYKEYYIPGIYANPDPQTMQMLEAANSRQDIIETITKTISTKPDVEE